MAAEKKRMKKRTYLIIWTIVIVLLCSAVGIANYEALYWDSALSLYFGEVGVANVSTVSFDTEDHAQVAELIVAEGTVLLKNENNALPMKAGKISLFGIDNKSGTLQAALEGEGFTVNPTLAAFYAASTHSSGAGSLSAGNGSETGGWIIDEVPQSEYTDEVKASYKDYNDAAIVVLMRTGAEGNDLPYDMSRYGGSADENYLELNQTEKDLLTAVNASFDKVIVLISSANAMQLDFVDREEYGIDAVLWYARPAGASSSIAKILTGAVNPSGRLVDTYVYDNLSSPAMQNFGDYRYVYEDGTLTGYSYVNYAEGIYVGYKYYETRYEDVVLKQGNAGDYDYASTVVYPFGYGLSYTTFDWSDLKVAWDGDTCTASVTVKNTGSVSGKDVVEFYIQSPYTAGGVEKAAVQLAQYGKTSELAPGASETVTVTFSKQDIASYDANDARAYVLDAGDWYVTAARNAHEAVNNVLTAKGKTTADGMTAEGNKDMAFLYTLSERELLSTDAVSGAEVTNRLDDIIYAEDTTYLSRSDWSVMENNGLEYATGVSTAVSNVGNASGDAPNHVISSELLANFQLTGFAASLNPTDPDDETLYPGKESYTYGAENGLTLADMVGVAYDDAKWDDLLNELKLSEMHQLFNKSGWGSLALDVIGKPKTYEYDAPNGIANFLTDAVIYSYPCATMTAATWSQEVQRIYGDAIGEDAIASNTEGWYAPGINIHRTPFGARNYEYYSEDAVLTGLCSAAVCAGVEAHGMHAYIKHFVMNDADTNRAANGCVAVWGTEQAAREIYLKPFQYSIQKGGAQGIMLTMCRIGWQYTWGSYPLMTAICRNEWGWHGCYITDYTTTMKGAGSDQYLAAGGSLVHATAEQTLSDVKAGWCRKLIREAAHEILYNTANSLAVDPAYAAMLNNTEDAVETASTVEESKGFLYGMAWYKVVLYGFDILMAIILILMAIRVYSKVPMTEEQFQNRKRMTRKGKMIMWIIIGVVLIALIVVFFVWAWPLLVKAFKI